MSEIVKRPSEEMGQSIENFSIPIANFLSTLGLPTEAVLNPIAERKDVIDNMEAALRGLSIDKRGQAHYISKFTVAVGVGLFDGALSYLWNETINTLRYKVKEFDLGYFYRIAGEFAGRYKNYHSEEDLRSVDDADLLKACNRIGIIPQDSYDRLIHINKMRNNASAAHPNSQQLDGLELISWLKTCLKHAIESDFDAPVLSIKRLLENFRKHQIPNEDLGDIEKELDRLTQNQVDDLIWNVFGQFCDPEASEFTRKNTHLLAVSIWQLCSETRKYEIGAKFGHYRGTGDVKRRENAQIFLDLVGASRYRDDDSLAAELIEKLENLKKVHFSSNNFYNEGVPARSLKESIPTTGLIPRSARTLWVKVISLGFVGNGLGYREGVDESALPYYESYIDNFSEDEIREFVYLFDDPEFSNSLNTSKSDKRARLLAKKLKDKSTSLKTKQAIEEIEKASEMKLSTVHLLNTYKKAVADLRTRALNL